MKARLTSSVILLAALLILSGCGSLKRVGADLAVVATSPLTVPLSATYDALDWGEELEGSPAPVLLMPFNWPLHVIKHFSYTTIYFADLFASPFYLLASITPQNDLSPIGIYSLTNGYPWKSAAWPGFEESGPSDIAALREEAK